MNTLEKVREIASSKYTDAQITQEDATKLLGLVKAVQERHRLESMDNPPMHEQADADQAEYHAMCDLEED